MQNARCLNIISKVRGYRDSFHHVNDMYYSLHREVVLISFPLIASTTTNKVCACI